MSDWITFTIDGKEVKAKQGELLTEAAARAGIQIPVFCSHPKLDPLGACRMCLVEMEGRRGKMLVTACTTPVTDGAVFYYDSPRAKDARKGTLELILANHPLDCPICDKGGECDLQDQAMEHGPGESHYWEDKRHKEKDYPLSDLIVLDQERCVLCWRCIRYLEQWEDKPQLGLFNRGSASVIDKFPEGELDAYTSGNIIDLCPVGALTNRLTRFRFRPWRLEHTDSICTHCGMGCNLRIDTRDFRVRRNVARTNMAVNDEWICDKGRFANGFVFSEQRLTQPLARIDGELQPVSWPEALDRVVEGLKAVVAKHGAASVGGIGSAKLSNEANYLLGKFMRSLIGTNNVDFREGAALKAERRGIPSLQDARDADLILLMGVDPSEEMPVLANFLKRAVKRHNAPVIIVHPRRIELAKYPGVFLNPAPGEETRTFDALTRATLEARGEAAPAWLSAAEDENIQQAAELLLKATKPFIIYGTDYAWGYGAAGIVQSLTNWVVASGHGDRLGFLHLQANAVGAADMGLLPDALPGHRDLGDEAARAQLEALWQSSLPTQPGLSYGGMIASALGRIKALYIMGADPVGEKPSYQRELSSLEFLVVQDLFLTETAQLADVVLPAASYVESSGTFTSTERRVQVAPQAARSVGDSLPDWTILMHIARRYAPEQAEAWRTPSPEAIFAEITQAVPQYAGMSWDNLVNSEGQQWAWDALPSAASLQPYQASEPAPIDKTFNTRLIVGSLLWDDGNVFAATERMVNLGRKAAWLHPDDASALGVREGDVIAVRSRSASLELPAHLSTTIQPGRVFVPFSLKDAPVGELFDEFGPRTTVAIYRV